MINGTFNIYPSKGIAEVDEFSLIIRDYIIDGLPFEDYTLNY